MARKKMPPAELSYSYKLTGETGTKYIDMAQSASAVSRKLFHQGKCYYLSRVTVNGVGATTATPAGSAIVTLATLPDTWVTANAWVKSKALWKSMQNRVLKDNPSIAGKWRDYKVFMDLAHQQGGTSSSGPTDNLLPIDFSGTEVSLGEWNMSTLVLPEHDVDPATGVVLPADEFEVHMMGDDNGGPLPANLASGGIIKMYQETRARQNAEPLVPAGMAENWGTQLTDSGSQDPELADIIDAENDLPPYENEHYPGGDNNFNAGVTQSILRVTSSLTQDKDLGFKVPLGLIKVLWMNQTGNSLTLTLHYTPGSYKGLMATEVKQ